jgi:UDPglucose 6-dehydrogenase
MSEGSFQPLKVTIIGTGYVGLTTGVCLAYLGHLVTCVDIDPAKLELLQRRKSPIHEPGLEELLGTVWNRIGFTSDTSASVADADVIMIAVGTPSKPTGQADNRYVEEAAREVAQGLQPGRNYVLVIKSTVPIGTNRRVVHVVDQVLASRGLKGEIMVRVASNPEFLSEGTALRNMFYPDRIVVGAEDPGSVEILRRLYRPILEQTFDPPPFLPRPEGYDLPPLITTDPVSAEMIKYAANAFLAMKISFINEIAGLCEKVGADVTEVARGIGLDPRIGPRFLEAGLGWGGSCFPKDTAALIAMGRELSYPLRLVEATRKVNTRQRERAVEKLQEALKGVRGRVIGVLGLAFKPGTDDVRESPSLDIIRLLLEREAHVRAHDPVAIGNARKALGDAEVEFIDDPYELANGADALVLATAWPEYRQLDLPKLAETMRTPVLLDGRNLFDPAEAREAGFIYLGVGRQ